MKVQPNTFPKNHHRTSFSRGVLKRFKEDCLDIKFQGDKQKTWENSSFIQKVKHNYLNSNPKSLITTLLGTSAILGGTFIFGAPLAIFFATLSLPVILLISLEPAIKAAMNIKKQQE